MQKAKVRENDSETSKTLSHFLIFKNVKKCLSRTLSHMVSKQRRSTEIKQGGSKLPAADWRWKLSSNSRAISRSVCERWRFSDVTRNSITMAFINHVCCINDTLSDPVTTSSATTVFINYKSSATTVFINYKSSVTTVFINCKSSATTVFINYKSSVTTVFINYKSSATTVFINYKSNSTRDACNCCLPFSTPRQIPRPFPHFSTYFPRRH